MWTAERDQMTGAATMPIKTSQPDERGEDDLEEDNDCDCYGGDGGANPEDWCCDDCGG